MNLLKIFFTFLLIQDSRANCPIGFTNSNGVCDECGQSFHAPEFRIIGGVAAIPYSWPAQALIFIKDKAGSNFQCGGTLIKRNYVLTAAHCIASLNPADYEVFLGVYKQSSNKFDNMMQVKQLIKNTAFSTQTYLNDLALIELSKPVVLSDRIQIACLPQQYNAYPTPNQPAWIVGWGTTKFQGSTSIIMKNAKIQVYDGTKCSNYGNDNNWNNQICAGNINGGVDACQGDSGGPLYVKQNLYGQNKYVLAGVVSYGRVGCAQKGYAGIYTRVSHYYNWIATNVGGL